MRDYAGFWIRVVANFLDALVIAIPAMILDYMAYQIAGPSNVSYLDYLSDPTVPFWSTYNTVGFILGTILGVLYYGIMTSKYKATVGKMIVGIQVINENDEAISFARATGRYFAYTLSGLILYIGYIMVAFSSKKQGLHDKICKTYVVHK